MDRIANHSGLANIPGYMLNLLMSRDAGSYSVSLHEVVGNDCGFSIFSDESGLVYERTVDCPKVDYLEEPIRSPKR